MTSRDIRIVLLYFDEARWELVRVRCDGYGCVRDVASPFHLEKGWEVTPKFLAEIGARFGGELARMLEEIECPA